MDVTNENTIITLNKNKQGVTITRKNFTSRALVEVRDKDNNIIDTYNFNNIDLKYSTKYMNWSNLNCCGGWEYDEKDLINQFKNDKKLFAQIVLDLNNNIDVHLLPLVEECSKLDGAKVVEVEHWTEGCKMFVMMKKGCVSNYLDVDDIINDYYSLGLKKLTDDQIQHLKNLCSEDMSCYISKNHNRYLYDFLHPMGILELIFTGMLLGYPIESTADRLGL